MNKFYKIAFNKKFKEDILVDFVCSILKNLYNNGHTFFIDNVLVDKKEYNFIFGGDMKFVKILVRDISEYIQIKNYEMVK